MRSTHLITRVLILLVVGGSIVSPRALAAKRIALIYADSTNHTLRTISGINWSLSNVSPPCEVVECYIDDFESEQAKKVKSRKPDILVTIGSSATTFANTHLSEIPRVFAKVLNPIESGFIQSWEQPGSKATGAALDIPADLQVKQLLSIIPNIERIGMIHTAQTRRLRDEAAAACSKNNIELISVEIASHRELPTALDSLCKIVDGFWTVADETLASPQFVRYIVMETMRHGIPIMGFNRNFVQNGALLCLEADYKYIGRQAGEIVGRLLNGEDPSSIEPTVPDIVYLYLNLKSSKLLNIDLAPEWISVARETF